MKEAAAIRLLGKRVGDRMALMHDAACHLRTFADALAVGRACDDANFFWYEDPYSDGGLSAFAHKKLRQLIRTPILLGEHVRGLELMATLLLAEGIGFRPRRSGFRHGHHRHDEDRASRRGARPRCRAARARARAARLHVGDPQHQLVRAVDGRAVRRRVHAAAATPAATPTGWRMSARMAAFPVPTGPGLGVTVDWDWIAAHRTGSHTSTTLSAEMMLDVSHGAGACAGHDVSLLALRCGRSPPPRRTPRSAPRLSHRADVARSALSQRDAEFADRACTCSTR